MSNSKSNVSTLEQLRAFDTFSSQTLDAKLEEVVSFQDYGAKGNGTNDDTFAINQALSSGKKLITGVAGSTYIISSSLVIPSGVIVDFRKSTVKRKQGSSFIFDMITGTGISDSQIRNLLVDGNKSADALVSSNPTSRFSGIAIKNSSRIHLENVNVTGTVNLEDARAGIYFENSSYSRLLNCSSYSNDKCGILFSGCSYLQVISVESYSNSGKGISSSTTSFSTYDKVSSHDNTDTQVNIQGTNNIICNSHIFNASTYGALNVGANSINNFGHNSLLSNLDIIGDVTIQYSDRVISNGIKIVGQITCTSCNNGEMNEIIQTGPATNGLAINNCSYMKVISGDFSANTQSGIYLNGGTDNMIGKSVSCFNNVISGVYINAGTNQSCAAKCFDNQSTKTQAYGIQVVSTAADISGAQLGGNLTAPLTFTAGLYLNFHGAKMGFDPLSGLLTTTVGSNVGTISNKNAWAIADTRGVAFRPTNAAAVTLGMPRIGNYTDGTQVTVIFPSNAAGTETYIYQFI